MRRSIHLCRAVRHFLAGVVLLPLAGCDAEGDSGPRGGELRVQLRGTSAFTAPFDQTMTGQAIFASVLTDGLSRLTIQLQDEGAEPFDLLTIAAAGTSRPAPGTYSVGPVPSATVLAADLVRSQASPRFTEFYAVESGTVTITASTAQRIDGRVSLAFRDGAHTATAEGTFSAVPGH